ncbi:MAG: hypothetical protein KAQ70_07085 [Candidatus Heimdallarchaeota archaeon]|nr:hypothetical protein [Candidatus Heimdallarchaeota archaeon]MCK5303926.1 hypothetical protein [Candidatus Heimdallarchaeota archaeon]MCK5409116.1 hypothetical protein [Candidatus Heimdallarchaeota archaeon]
MSYIEKEDLISSLKDSNGSKKEIDMEAVDFVLLKLNELRHEISLKFYEKKIKNSKRSGS